MIDFPSNPTDGQIYTAEGTTWIYRDPPGAWGVQSAGGAGGGLYKGNNGTVGSSAGDIFRINDQVLSADVIIDADENASCSGPLTVATGVTLTVATGGNLSII